MTALMSATFGMSAQQVAPTTSDSVATVYFIKDITPGNILKIYDALDRRATGKVCVKLSFGESGNPNHLSPQLIEPLVKGLDATLVECNTAYQSSRRNSADHLKTAEEHGFTAIAPIDIMDEAGETILHVTGGKHIDHALIGDGWLKYDFTIVLSHFKGHPSGGFGGALKNMAIGMQSSNGKAWVHTAGKNKDADNWWNDRASQDDFLETMAESSKAIIDRAGDNILYISVANNLSVDCDCVAHPAPVQMADIGIFASLDPVALDRACVDAIHNSSDHGKIHMEQRIAELNGTHLLDYAESLGIGTQKYVLITIE
ncbi:DUF362 domain-containing protein [uncultured Muribaculum sp.]|mgnify:FL=1|nr:DUF362 domain-containing protein [uncultured Muribaculum sp.]